METCERCKREVKKNEEAMELGSSKIYHKDCFKCDHCDLVIDNQPFVPMNGKILHKHCYEDHYLEKCYSCSLKIQSKYIVWSGKKFHSECFKCDGCGDGLSSQQYTESNGKKLCPNCPQKNVSNQPSQIPPKNLSSTNTSTIPDTDNLITCPVCSKKIFPNENNISIHTNKAFHQACLRCNFCGNLFEDGKLQQENGKYYHKKCLQEMAQPKCDKCQKSMTSFIQFKTQKLHPECFTCSKCLKRIGSEGIAETPSGDILCFSCETKWKNENTKVTPDDHKICFLCHKSVLDGIIVKGQTIHKECFKCGICDGTLKKDDNITEDRGFFLHVECLKNEVEEKCDKCGKILNENYITLNGSFFHEECVTCSKCNCTLSNTRFTEKDGSLLCKTCLPSHRFGDTDIKSGSNLNRAAANPLNVPDGCCPKCLKKVYMSDTVNGPRATVWHRACLCCNVCRKPLDTYAVIVDGSVFCSMHGRRK